MNPKRFFQNTERFGALVLFFVILGSIGAFLSNTTSLNNTSFYGIVLVVCSLIVSVAHQIGKRTSKTRIFLSGTLLVYAAMVFFINENYLDQVILAKIPFWYLVSIYSLPAIALEGAIFTLLDELRVYYKNDFRSQVLIVVLFALYALVAVSTNFAAILGYISIGHQVFFSRTILVLVIVSIVMFLVKFYKKDA